MLVFGVESRFGELSLGILDGDRLGLGGGVAVMGVFLFSTPALRACNGVDGLKGVEGVHATDFGAFGDWDRGPCFFFNELRAFAIAPGGAVRDNSGVWVLSSCFGHCS